jgi:hypothetical protein
MLHTLQKEFCYFYFPKFAGARKRRWRCSGLDSNRKQAVLLVTSSVVIVSAAKLR